MNIQYLIRHQPTGHILCGGTAGADKLGEDFAKSYIAWASKMLGVSESTIEVVFRVHQ